MNNQIKTAIQEIVEKAVESPQKYCRLFWQHDSKELSIGKSHFDINKAILIYQDDGQRKIVDVSESDKQFLVLCNPKKNMAFIAEDSDKNKYYKYFCFGGIPSKLENNNDELFVCVAETTFKNTFVIAYLKGIYFLQSFDSEYSITLFGVIKALLEPNSLSGKEETYNVEEKEEISERRFLGLL